MEEIKKAYFVNAPLKQVYDKWISNDTVIPPAIKMDITPQVGGKYILISKLGDKETTMTGVFKEVLPYKKLVYTWEWDKDGNESLVMVSFIEEQNKTRIELEHVGLKDRESLSAHSDGWDSYISGLKALFSTSS
jgi:uncharacterized protein YndB with AHSA1/START domain